MEATPLVPSTTTRQEAISREEDGEPNCKKLVYYYCFEHVISEGRVGRTRFRLLIFALFGLPLFMLVTLIVYIPIGYILGLFAQWALQPNTIPIEYGLVFNYCASVFLLIMLMSVLLVFVFLYMTCREVVWSACNCCDNCRAEYRNGYRIELA